MPYLYADPLECTGCRICELFCAFLHERVLNPRKARLRVTRLEPSLDVPIACRHCQEPMCAKACPVDAIGKVRKTGMVFVEKGKCVGCRLCLDACPYGAMFTHPDKLVAMNCTLCGFCVEHCPVRCLKVVEGR
ncbi:MAG: Hdr-like menaquinol oxidoreductase iron-sulfur subunit 1 precursor [Candidatus Bathyarchaeota archaeon BA1]|nr:MAG: Hdr-like menaquinol oxidoreductase iron-sulfur subunit 1 precursor [Candidatus Bathyarchaeota archaeon BA1]